MPSATLTMNETEWQQSVIELAQAYGWRVAHFRAAKTERGWRTPVQADGAGFPDLVLVRPPELLFAELKSDKGRLSPDQVQWLSDLALCGIVAEMWRPRDFDAVHERLKPRTKERS